MKEKQRRIAHFLLTVAAAAGCAFFSIPCAVIVTVLSAALFVLYELALSKRRDQVMTLCDEIDRILRNDDRISFDEFQEGELSVLAAEIHKMTIRLREQNTALLREKQFAREALEDISHQLRTPLTSVMMILGLMRSSGLTDENRREYLGDLYELLARMKWLIETMLSLSRIEADAAKFAKETVPIRKLITQSVDAVSVTAELKGVDVAAEIEGEPVFVGDLHYTSEAVVNLLKNAIEHTPEGGTVTVTAKESSLSTEITIADTGAGIPEEELPHIFERFYRASSYTKNGFGIGLAFAKKVIIAQNGSLRASDCVPHGAVFEIRFYKTIV